MLEAYWTRSRQPKGFFGTDVGNPSSPMCLASGRHGGPRQECGELDLDLVSGDLLIF